MSQPARSRQFLDIEFPAEVWLAEESMPLGRLLELQPGSILSLQRDPDGPVDLVVNGTVVAQGELVVVEGKFALRITATPSRTVAEMQPTDTPEAQS